MMQRVLPCGESDLYLLHWPGAVPLQETVDAFESLRGAGKSRHWGVSNFDADVLMAYSPFDQGRLLRDGRLVRLAQEHGVAPGQLAIAWLLAQDGVIAIPKSGSPQRVEENAAAIERPLTSAELGELDALFAPPPGPSSLAML